MDDKKLKAFVIQTLRRGSYRWPGRYKAKAKAKIARNQYTCYVCSGIFGHKDIQLDHKLPVVPTEGFKTGSWDWNEYIQRMFVDEHGYGVICTNCHDIKSAGERTERAKTRRKK